MTGKRSILLAMAAVLLLATSLMVGCGGAAAPAPTSAPQPAAKPAEPTKAPAAPAPTQAAAVAPTQAAAAAPTKPAAPAPTQAPDRAVGFFEGKTVNTILPNSAGGGLDITTRYMLGKLEAATKARFPLENMVGAAGLKGYNAQFVTKGDGLHLGAGSLTTMLLQQLSELEGITYDARKNNYLGKIYSEPRLLLVPYDSPLKTFDDVLKLGRPVNMPIQGVDDDFLSIALVNHFLDIKTKVITGYAGQADVFLAVLRGEGDWAAASTSTAAPMIRDKEMRAILVVYGTRLPEYPDLPTTLELVKTPEAKAAMEAVNKIVDLHASFFFPPGVDPKIVAEGRYILGKIMTDPAIVAEAPSKTGGRKLTYVSGEDMQKAIPQILDQGKTLTPILKETIAALK